MVVGPERLEQLQQARQENRVHPLEELVAQIEAQIDDDLKGGWGGIQERFLDQRDPRSVLIGFTVELDPTLVTELAELEPESWKVVQRELQRRYLAAGFFGVKLLDEGRVHLEHIIGPITETIRPGQPLRTSGRDDG